MKRRLDVIFFKDLWEGKGYLRKASADAICHSYLKQGSTTFFNWALDSRIIKDVPCNNPHNQSITDNLALRKNEDMLKLLVDRGDYYVAKAVGRSAVFFQLDEVVEHIMKKSDQFNEALLVDVFMYGRRDLLEKGYLASINIENHHLWTAAIHGHLPLLQWLYKQNESLNFHVCAMFASREGHAHIIGWLHSLGFSMLGVVSNFAKGGHSELVKRALKGEWGEASVNRCADGSIKFIFLGTEIENLGQDAVMGGSLDLVKWLGGQGLLFEESLISFVIKYKYHDILEWLIESRYPDYVFESCIPSDVTLETLELALKHG